MTDFNQKYIFLKSFLGLPELSAEQLFFLNFAQVIKEYCRGVFVFVLLQIFYHSKVWCGASRPEALQSKLKTAVHAPGKYRWGNNGHGSNGHGSNGHGNNGHGNNGHGNNGCDNNSSFVTLIHLHRVLGTLANSVEFSEAWQCRFFIYQDHVCFSQYANMQPIQTLIAQRTFTLYSVQAWPRDGGRRAL